MEICFWGRGKWERVEDQIFERTPGGQVVCVCDKTLDDQIIQSAERGMSEFRYCLNVRSLHRKNGGWVM